MKKDYLERPSVVSILTMDRLSLTQRAVNSILENSSEDVRMIFLDNASKDRTLEYLNDLKSQYSDRVTVLTSDINLGVSKGRNEIFKRILSDYKNNFNWVLSLDNDCLVHEGYDKAITNVIRDRRADIVCPGLIQPNGRTLYNVNNGFMIDLKNKKFKLEYRSSENISQDKDEISKLESDVILGTSAKTPGFFQKVGFYDEGHKIGWEDFSLSLKTLGLTKRFFDYWTSEECSEGWIPLKDIIDEKNKSLAKIIFEPNSIITHDHPKTEEYKDYHAIRSKKQTIKESTDHFENVWGIRPVYEK